MCDPDWKPYMAVVDKILCATSGFIGVTHMTKQWHVTFTDECLLLRT